MVVEEECDNLSVTVEMCVAAKLTCWQQVSDGSLMVSLI